MTARTAPPPSHLEDKDVQSAAQVMYDPSDGERDSYGSSGDDDEGEEGEDIV